MSKKNISRAYFIVFFVTLICCISCNGQNKNIAIQNAHSDDNISINKVNIDTISLNLIMPTCYHENEVSKSWEDDKWIGIFKKDGSYYMDSASIKVVSACDQVLGESEEDTISWTGYCIEPLNKDTCLFLVTEFPNFKYRVLNEVIDSAHYFIPFKFYDFEFRNNKYTLYAETDSTLDEYGETVWKNYALYLKGFKKNKQIIQKLFIIDNMDYNMTSIELIADFDNDGFPDFLINKSSHYNVYHPTLFLSSFAKDSELVKMVAEHISVGC